MKFEEYMYVGDDIVCCVVFTEDEAVYAEFTSFVDGDYWSEMGVVFVASDGEIRFKSQVSSFLCNDPHAVFDDKITFAEWTESLAKLPNLTPEELKAKLIERMFCHKSNLV